MHLKIFVLLALAALISGQRRYYSLEDMPETNFDCRDKILGGYYADPEANCQMFHVCVKIPGQGVQDFRFLCPNETAFDQENQICADSGDIDCAGSGLYLENFDLYRIGSSPAKRPVPSGGNKGAVLPLGPSTKSPILTNNIYEDDDFYLQKSETGDRRLHSKDILRGSSSSNFFNNRNKGKDLDDDEDDAPPKKSEVASNNNNQFRPRPNAPNQFRPKTQFQSQFRKAEPTATTSTQQSVVENQNQLNDKKRTKIAVRKLTRKKPEDEVTARPPQPTQQSGFSSFTTQVTQKFGSFGDNNAKYNTVNRPATTPSTLGTSDGFKQQNQPQVQQQQTQQSRFPNFKKIETQTTPAFFEPSSTSGGSSKGLEPAANGNKDTTPFSLLRNPIVAAGPNYNANQNRQQNRQTTANYPQPASNGNFPSPTPNGNFQTQNPNLQQKQNRQNAPGNTNFQQQPQQNQFNRQTPTTASGFPQQSQPQQNQFNRQTPTTASGFPQQSQPQQFNRQPPNAASNFPQQQPQQNRQSSSTPQNFQPSQQQPQQEQNRSPLPVRAQGFPQQRQNGNFQSQQPQQPQQQQQPTQAQSSVNGGTFSQNRQQVNNGNFQQQSRQQPQGNNGNFQENRQGAPVQVRGQNGQQAFNNNPQGFNAQQQNFNGQGNNRQFNQRQNFNRNFDEFDDGDNQEFLKTAPSNNFHPSDFNSFTNNNYKSEVKNNSTKFAEILTTKYITPTIITTPKPTPSYDTPPARQNFYSSPSNSYTPTVSTTQRPATASSVPPSSRLPQRIYPSPTPSKAPEAKDVAYDYAYYDDSGSFSDYSNFDHLGESDFSRTSQRAKSRLI